MLGIKFKSRDIGVNVFVVYNVIGDEKMKKICRKQYIDKLISLKDKNIIKVLTGIRCSGKSTILQEFKEYLIGSEVSKDNIIFINLDDRNYRHLLDTDTLHDYILNNIDLSKKNYVFLDEIQNVCRFEKTIDSLFLRENLDIYNWVKFIYVIW